MASLPGWSKRIKLTSDNTKVDSDLTHFPITAFLKSGNGETTKVFDEVGANNLKIAIADDAATPVQYYVEIEQWDSSGKVGVLHFGKSGETLPSASAKDYYLYYDAAHADNTDFVGVQGSTPGKAVYKSDFKLVWHQNSLTTTTTEKDSSNSANDGTKKANNEPADAVGLVGRAKDYDGVDDYTTKTSAADMAWGTGDYAWYQLLYMDDYTNSASANVFTGLLGTDASHITWGIIFITDNHPTTGVRRQFNIFSRSSADAYKSVWCGTARTKETWYLVAGKRVGGDLFISVNGGAWVAGDTGANKNWGANGRITTGSWYTTGTPPTSSFFNGRIDKTAVLAGDVSDGWIKATYNSLNDSLLTYGSEETPVTTKRGAFFMVM